MNGPRGRQPDQQRAHASAVSLIEVLVVIGIIALLLAMLIPSLQYAREQSRRLVCKTNLHNWDIALECYLNDYGDYLPTEGTYLKVEKPYSWFNVLPPYLDVPAYKDVERQGTLIRDFPAMHVWICPSKNLSDANKSGSGKNQFHYGMNEVLDGRGRGPNGSKETPGFPDMGEHPIRADRFCDHPETVFLFDIDPNSPHGYQRNVATRFHGDYANVLTLDGRVRGFRAMDFVTGGDSVGGNVIWDHHELYWGYRPPPR